MRKKPSTYCCPAPQVIFHLLTKRLPIKDDLSPLTRQYRGAGSAAYHPSALLALLIYGYATGTFGPRRIEQVTDESLAFRNIAANTHPDHETLCTFRKRFLAEIEALFVQVLSIARQMKLLTIGTVALDSTKLHANASRHSALSYGHAQKIEAQLQAEVKARLARAAAADAEPLPPGLDIPAERARREVRLQAIRAAKTELDTRAAERDTATQTYKPNSTIALAWRDLVRKPVRLDELTASEYLAHARSGERSQPSIMRMFLSWPFNPIGNILHDAVGHVTTSYLARMHDLDGKLRLLELKRRIREQNIEPSAIQAFLDAQAPELRDPYTGEAMHHDPERGVLGFNARSPRYDSENWRGELMLSL